MWRAASRPLRGGTVGAFLWVAALALPPAPGFGCSTDVVWRANLTGAELTPAVETAARGTVVFHFGFPATEATVDVDLENVADVTAIEFRAGDNNKPGPVIFTLYSRGKGVWSRRLVRKITEKDLIRHREVGVSSFSDAMRAILDGTGYVVVSTRAYKDGELRGRIAMRREVVYSADEGDAGHDPLLHQKALPPLVPADAKAAE